MKRIIYILVITFLFVSCSSNSVHYDIVKEKYDTVYLLPNKNRAFIVVDGMNNIHYVEVDFMLEICYDYTIPHMKALRKKDPDDTYIIVGKE